MFLVCGLEEDCGLTSRNELMCYFLGKSLKKEVGGKKTQPCAENALADGTHLFQTPGPSLPSILLFLVLDPFTGGETNAKSFPIAPLRFSDMKIWTVTGNS